MKATRQTARQNRRHSNAVRFLLKQMSARVAWETWMQEHFEKNIFG